MNNILLTSLLAISFFNFAINPAQSFCTYITNRSNSTLDIRASVANVNQTTDIAEGTTFFKAKTLLNPNDPTYKQCFNWEDVYKQYGIGEIDKVYINHLEIKGLEEKFTTALPYKSTQFENAGFAYITVTQGSNANELKIEIIGYNENGKFISNTNGIAEKKQKTMHKK